MSPSILLIAFFQAVSPIVKLDSRENGRTFYVDTDKPEIRKALRDVSVPSPAGSVPEWLPPYPAARVVPHRGDKDPIDFGVMVYETNESPDAVFTHYETAIRAGGATITYINRRPGRGGAIHADDGARTAVISVSPGPGGTAISVNWRPKVINPPVIPKTARLVVVWYDDGKGILRLRDPGSGKEYELGLATMLRYARSEPLEPSARGDFPAWLAFYPGAKVVVANAPPVGWQPRTAIDMRTFNVEMETTASVAEVAAFYRDVIAKYGLTLISETKSQDRSYSFEARSADRMHKMDLNVLKRAKETFIRLNDTYTLPR